MLGPAVEMAPSHRTKVSFAFLLLYLNSFGRSAAVTWDTTRSNFSDFFVIDSWKDRVLSPGIC